MPAAAKVCIPFFNPNLSLKKSNCIIVYIVASKFISIPANLMVFAANLIGPTKVVTRSLSY